jgi:hypothetical protein
VSSRYEYLLLAKFGSPDILIPIQGAPFHAPDFMVISVKDHQRHRFPRIELYIKLSISYIAYGAVNHRIEDLSCPVALLAGLAFQESSGNNKYVWKSPQ